MKQQDINDLLSGLLGEQPRPKQEKKPAPAPVQETKRPAASEKSRQRVEELLRSVELENCQRKAAAPQKRGDMTIPKRDPVPVPPPVSHFTDEPSQNPAVRMRDRLDETALPMLDSERKPNQIIPPKPRTEPPKKKRKKRPAPQQTAENRAEVQPEAVKSADIPAPAAPKKKIMHINVPDELPPDIPREIPAAETGFAEPEPREAKLKIMHINVPDELPPDIPREIPVPEEIPAEPVSADIPAPSQPKRRIPHIVIPDELPPDIPQDASEADEIRRKISAIQASADAAPAQQEEAVQYDAHEQEILRRAESIKAQIRLAMEEIQAVPEVEEDELDALPEADTAAEQPDEAEIPEEIPKKAKSGGLFRRKTEEPAYDAPDADAAPEAVTEPEIPAEPQAPEVPKAPRLRHLSAVDEPKEKSGLLGFSRKKKQNLTADVTSAASEAEIMAILGENPDPMPAPEKRGLFRRREKIVLIPEPVEYDDVPEDPISPDEAESVPDTAESPQLPEPEEMQSNEETVLDQVPEPKGIGASIRAALDENVQELADVKAEVLPDDGGQSGSRIRRLRRRSYFIAGILCSALALVGIGTCVVLAAQAIRNFAGSSSLTQELEDVVYPAVVVDLPDFENAADAAPETLLSAAVIDLVMFGDLSGYSEAFDVISVPAEDIRTRANSMFGIEITGDYETLYAAGELFFYDETTGCYNVPSAPVIFSYAPEITEIRRSDDVYTLTVAYRADMAQWQERSENFSHMGEKTMEITVEKHDGNYRIVRMMNVSEHSDGI